ncbi:Erlin-2, partial [Bienertia sinuspersici]
MEQKLMEKEIARRLQQIDNEMNYSSFLEVLGISLSLPISVNQRGEANKLKLTPQYLELGFIEGTTNNTKIYFGKKIIPNMVFDQMLLGHYLEIVAKMP